MPSDDPGKVSTQQKADILAYMLRVGELPRRHHRAPSRSAGPDRYQSTCQRSRDRSTTTPEANPRKPFAIAIAAQRHFVAIGEVAVALRLPAASSGCRPFDGQFQKAAATVVLRARIRCRFRGCRRGAGCSRCWCGASAAVRSSNTAREGSCGRCWPARCADRACAPTESRHQAGDRCRRRLAFAAEDKYGKRHRIVSTARERRAAERRKRLERHDPGRHRGGEALRQKRPERLILPRLDVAGGPVVEEAQSRRCGLPPASIGTGSPSVLPGPTNTADFEFVIEHACRTKHGLRLHPAPWSVPRAGAPASRSRRSTRRGRDTRSARTCSSAAADCRGETGVRHASRGTPRHRSRCSRRPSRAPPCSTSRIEHQRAWFRPRTVGSQQPHQLSAQRAHGRRSERHQTVQRRRSRAPPAPPPADPATARVRSIDASPGPRRRLRRRSIGFRGAAPPEHAERKILDGEVGIGMIGGVDPAAECRIVGFVDRSTS